MRGDAPPAETNPDHGGQRIGDRQRVDGDQRGELGHGEDRQQHGDGKRRHRRLEHLFLGAHEHAVHPGRIARHDLRVGDADAVGDVDQAGDRAEDVDDLLVGEQQRVRRGDGHSVGEMEEPPAELQVMSRGRRCAGVTIVVGCGLIY